MTSHTLTEALLDEQADSNWFDPDEAKELKAQARKEYWREWK